MLNRIPRPSRLHVIRACWVILLVCLATSWLAAQDTSTRVWALYLKQQKDSEKKPVARKHFFVFYSTNPSAPKLKKEDFFKTLVAAVGRPPTLQDYQAALVKAGIPEAKAKEFIENWVLKYRCETVYCQDITPDDLTKISLFKEAYDANAPLFAKAPDAGRRSYRWLPNFLPEAVRIGYYDMRRNWTNCAAAYLRAGPEQKGLGMTVLPGMTNEQGTTLFSRLPAGTFYVSNLVPLEIGSDLSKSTPDLWFVIKEIKATTVSGKVEVSAFSKDKVDAKDLQSSAAPTFTCAP